MKISFKLKLVFSYILVALISFGCAAFFLDRKLEEKSLNNIKTSLITQARLIQPQIQPESFKNKDTPSLETLAKTLTEKTLARITIINSQGEVLADSEKNLEDVSKMENHIGRPEIKIALAGEIGIDTRYSFTLKMNMLYVAVPLRDNNEILGVLRLSLPLESVRKTLAEVRGIVLIGFIFVLVFAGILGAIVANRIIKPINKMIEASRKFSEGDFSRRVIHAPPDEIGELAATLNKMAGDIEGKIKEIKTQNQKLAAIFNSMIEGVIVVDKQGHIISVNRTIEKIFGLSKEGVVGKAFLGAIRNTDIAEVINSVLLKGEALSKEVSLIYPVRRIFEVNATAIFDNNLVSACLVVIHDITERRRLETMRSDFVANVSHELRTPLTSIKGFVETLLEGAIDDKANSREFLRIIEAHAERLNSLVNDLLSLSHLESKDITLDKESFNLTQQLDSVIRGFNSQLNKKGIQVKNELPAGLLIRADKHRIDQVLTNLIDNAIKFNKEKGSIKIYIKETDGKVAIVVEDTGMGIPQKDLPRIFERFYRVDKARSRELGGTGLGLSIVKHIIELHSGSVGMESTEGLGSKFWFILPK